MWNARKAAVTIGSFAAIAVVACGAPPSEREATGTTDEAASILGPTQRYCLRATDPITDKTAPAEPVAGWTCGCFDYPVPTSLAGMGCTQGVALQGYVCGGGAYSAWAWACPSYAVRYALAAQLNGDFGGQLPASEDVVEEVQFPNSCYGAVDSDYAIIVESNQNFTACSPVSCQGPACGSPVSLPPVSSPVLIQ